VARLSKAVLIWALAMLVALPSTASRLENATLGPGLRAALDKDSPILRNSGLHGTAGSYAIRPGTVRRVAAVAVDLGALVTLARAATRPVAAPATMVLATSGAVAAPLALVLPQAPESSVHPRPRPAGMERRVVQYSERWLRNVTARALSDQEQCLATAIYHEARGEDLKGQFAVAEVVLNRVSSRKFPGSICDVVYQGARAGSSGGCQFSFACDGRPDAMNNRRASDLARRIAQVMADGGHRGLTDGATYFHTIAVRPDWSQRFSNTARIGAHLFYRG
jgi:hypothetical protein